MSNLGILNGTLDPNKYCNVLTKFLLPFASEECPANWIFQQDNPPCHGSKFTKEFLFDSDPDVLRWNARSPDVNVIENLWKLLARAAHKDNKQFGSK